MQAQVEVARQRPDSLVDVRGGEVRGITIAVPLTEERKWLVARMPESAVQALLAQATALPESQRSSFINDWIRRNQEAVYDAYLQFTESGGSGRRFTYAVVLPESPSAQAAAGPLAAIPRTVQVPETIPARTETPAPATPPVQRPAETPAPATVAVVAPPVTPAVVPPTTRTAPAPAVAPITRPGQVVGGVPQPGMDVETGHVYLSFNVLSSTGAEVPVFVDVDSGFLDNSAYPTAEDRAQFLASGLHGALGRSTYQFLGLLSGNRERVVVMIDGLDSDLDSLRRLFETGSSEAPVIAVAPPPEETVVSPPPQAERREPTVRFTSQGDGTEENPYVIEAIGGSGRRARLPFAFTTSDNSARIHVTVLLRESHVRSGAIATTRNDLKTVCMSILTGQAGLSGEEARTMLPPIGPGLGAVQRRFEAE